MATEIERRGDALGPLSDYALAELERVREELELDIARIKTQLENAKAVRIETGEYADARWFAAASGALRFKGAEHQKVLRELAARKRAINKSHHEQQQRSGERAFVQAAKRRLTTEVYLLLWEEANEAVRAEEES